MKMTFRDKRTMEQNKQYIIHSAFLSVCIVDTVGYRLTVVIKHVAVGQS